MLLPVKWLKEYIKTDKDGRELADGLTLSGSHVESINSLNKGIEKVVVGKIITLEKHSDADKLWITTIDIGTEVIVIVTGATNIKVGDIVPVALVGAVLPGGIKIGKTDFRGVDSFGMLCSLKELGYNENVIPKEVKDGIFILDKEYELGADILNVMGLNSEVIEFEITPNRPDCLSILGMARETAATFSIPLEEPIISINNETDNINDYLDNVQVNSENCFRYYARVLKDVKIGPSPLWLQTSLMAAGIRPISNIVDITNYVMLEYGEPLHAFDLDKVNGSNIIVRQAYENEKILTLDGVERILDNNDLVIADSENALAIAGVMGGLNSEITIDTSRVLLEGANFNEKSVRLTSKKFNLRSEASNRFEKGIDPNLCNIAVDRVCQLVEMVGAATVVKESIDVYNNEKKVKTITVRPERVNMLLGIDITTSQMIQYLNGLGLESNCSDGVIHTLIPTVRLDLNKEVDLIEEIGRLYGFHNITSKPLLGVLTRGEKPYSRTIEDKVKFNLLGLGFNEIMTYSFISPKAYDKINLKADSPLRDYIKLLNPLGEDYSIMRTTLIPTMMELLSRNYNRGVESSYAFEIGNIFIAKSLPVVELPSEKKVLSIGFYGEDDFFFLKESVNKVLNRLGIKELSYIREENNESFHPGRTAKIIANGQELGIIGEIHVDVLENYDIGKKVYISHLDFDKIIEMTNLDIKYKPLPKYPSMARDIAVVVKESVLVGDLEKIILKHGEGLIEKVELFDIYRGNQIEEGLKSIAFSIIYRSYEKTLTEEEVNKTLRNIMSDLEATLDAKLRS